MAMGPKSLSLRDVVPFCVFVNTALLLFLCMAPSTISPSKTPPPGGVAEVGASASQCREALLAARNQLASLSKLRKEYGVLYCKQHGIGPTGGFCAVGQNISTLHAFDEPLAAKLAELFAAKRVVDLGAGHDLYGKYWEATGVKYTGYDGAEGIEDVTSMIGSCMHACAAVCIAWCHLPFPHFAADGYLKFLDLSIPQYLEESFDWAISLEVGEHIPAEFEETYIANLVRHATEGIVTSWAVPGQGGHHHVNEQTNDHVIMQFERLGVKWDTASTNALRAVASLRWLKNTLLVFKKPT